VEDALKMLDRAVASKPELLPSVIFLDLNMPLLNGWDFLYAYEQLPEFVRNHCSLYVLSGTENANALVRSRRARNVRACLSKPLSNEDLEVIKLQATGNWE
jgi:CheY-like chemotaxis protein